MMKKQAFITSLNQELDKWSYGIKSSTYMQVHDFLVIKCQMKGLDHAIHPIMPLSSIILPLLSIGQGHIFITGSFAQRVLDKRSQYNDIDIFVKSQVEWEIVKQFAEILSDNEADHFNMMNCPQYKKMKMELISLRPPHKDDEQKNEAMKLPRIDFVYINEPDLTMKQFFDKYFDLDFCKVGFDGNIVEITNGLSLIQKKSTYCKDGSPDMNRIRKYVKRGYHITGVEFPPFVDIE